ncbi:arginase family protein [Candidatus Woesearchaeota archaeon]|nr:arginase family protein [Candidatus Woesearchaeota archaeon]
MDVVKIRSSQGSLGKNLGCEKAPDLIIEKFNEMFLNENYFSSEINVYDITIYESNIEKTNESILNEAKRFDKAIFLGGDHSITYNLFNAFSSKFRNTGLLIFDAHPDCEVYTDIAAHEDFVRKLIDDMLLEKENVILVGLRIFSENEIKFLKDNKIKFFSMKDIFNDLQNVCDEIMELSRNFDGLYLSIDIDVVDPAYAPGTGYLEVGGLSSRELLYFIQRIKLLKNLKFIDIVEINPKKDINNMTVMLGAKILKELI